MTAGRAARLIALVVGLAACGPERNGTLYVLEVRTENLSPAELERVEVQVRSERGGEVGRTFPVSELPGRLALVPRGDPDLAFEVTARALRGTQEIHSVTAALRFVPDQALEGTLLISRSCSTLVPARPACATGTESCVQGRCLQRDRVVLDQRRLGSDGGVPDGPLDDPADGPPDGPADRPADGRAPDGSVITGSWAVSAMDLTPGGSLNAVFPVAGNDVWAVGVSAGSGPARGVAFHWDGRSWSESQLPVGTQALYGVWAAEPDDVWVVGLAGTVLRLTGGVWQPVVTGTTVNFSGVWGASAADVWIVGYGRTALHWDGIRVAPGGQGISGDLTAVAGLGTGDVWTVGPQGAVYRGSIRGFDRQLHDLTDGLLYAVWPVGPADVWVVGQNAALHFDGNGWTSANISAQTTALGVWGAAANDVWAVGRASGGGGFISHFNGLAWTPVLPNPPTSLQAIRGRSARDIWAVGEAGTIMHFE
jgi:hypothetical protein